MKSRLLSGIPLIIFGTLISIGPRTIFPVCDASMMVMDCHWTAQAELGVGAVIALIGVLALILPCTKVRAGLGLAAALNGGLAILIPTTVIGVCGSEHMNCRALTLPALVILGAATIVVGLLATLPLFKSTAKGSEAK